MALRFDPITGQMIDDGLPALDGAAPPLADPAAALDTMPGVGPENLQVESGGSRPAAAPAAPAAAIQAATVFPAKPEHETKVEQSQKTGGVVESTATKEADANLQAEREKAQAAQDADTAIKVREAEAKAEDAKLARLTVEKKQAADAYWEDQKRRKVEELKKADDLAIEESKKDETLKNNAGILTGAAKTWATVLTALGALGQGLAAAGSRGAQAWQDGNPIAKLYEEDRQKAQAKALADFQKSERYRALKKAGRDAELKVIEDRLTIGVNNEFKRDTDLREALLAERIAKQGPQAQKVAGELLKTGKAETYATIDRENATKYDQHLEQGRSVEDVHRSPTSSGGGAVAARADDTAVFDPATGQKLFDATTPQQAKELNVNGGSLNGIRSDLAKYRELMAQLPKGYEAVSLTDPKMQELAKQAELLKQGMIGQYTNMTGAGAPSGSEKKDFEGAIARGNLDRVEAHANALDAAGEQMAQRWKAQLPAYGYKAASGPAAKGEPKAEAKTDLGKQAASRMAPASWKGVRKVISSGTYERTGPGPTDWKKVK
jgi:hypothetical protein